MYAYRKEEFLENFIYQVLELFDNSCNEEEFVPAAKDGFSKDNYSLENVVSVLNKFYPTTYEIKDGKHTVTISPNNNEDKFSFVFVKEKLTDDLTSPFGRWTIYKDLHSPKRIIDVVIVDDFGTILDKSAQCSVYQKTIGNNSYNCFFRHNQGLYYCYSVSLHEGYMKACISDMAIIPSGSFYTLVNGTIGKFKETDVYLGLSGNIFSGFTTKKPDYGT